MRFLFVDRVFELSSTIARGIKHISEAEPYLCRNEEGDICFIPSMVGETLGQLTAWNTMVNYDFKKRSIAGIAARACLYRPAYIGETLLLESFIDHWDETAVTYHGTVRVGSELIFSVEGGLGPSLPMTDFIEPEEARAQFNQIYQPGHWPPSVMELSSPIDRSIKDSFQVAAPMKFNKIISSEPGKQLGAELYISPNAPFFADHFPRKPVLPLTVLLEAKRNLTQELVAQAGWTNNYRVSELRKIKMNEFIHPGDLVTCIVNVKHRDENQLVLSYRSEVEKKRVCVVEIVMMAKGSQ